MASNAGWVHARCTARGPPLATTGENWGRRIEGLLMARILSPRANTSCTSFVHFIAQLRHASPHLMDGYQAQAWA